MSWAPPSTDDRALPQRSDPAQIAVAFTRVLRGAGLRVPSNSTHTFAEALCAVGLEERAGVYWSGRATLARRPEDIEIYDQLARTKRSSGYTRHILNERECKLAHYHENMNRKIAD